MARLDKSYLFSVSCLLSSHDFIVLIKKTLPLQRVKPNIWKHMSWLHQRGIWSFHVLIYFCIVPQQYMAQRRI